MSVDAVEAAAVPLPAASFLTDPEPTEAVARMYHADLVGQGYVARLSRLWAQSPEAMASLTHALSLAVELAGLDFRQRAVVVTACAAAMNDSYCSLAWGTKLASVAGPQTAADVVSGTDAALTRRERVLAAWARRLASDPNSTTAEDVAALRTVGFEDRQVFALTFFVALRIAFSTVNDALGASPDDELVLRAPDALLAAVRFGRAPRL